MYIEMNPRRVRALRKLRGMSRDELAAEAGISVKTARRVERGEPVQGDTANAVAKALGEGPSEALGRVLHR